VGEQTTCRAADAIEFTTIEPITTLNNAESGAVLRATVPINLTRVFLLFNYRGAKEFFTAHCDAQLGRWVNTYFRVISGWFQSFFRHFPGLAKPTKAST